MGMGASVVVDDDLAPICAKLNSESHILFYGNVCQIDLTGQNAPDCLSTVVYQESSRKTLSYTVVSLYMTTASRVYSCISERIVESLVPL